MMHGAENENTPRSKQWRCSSGIQIQQTTTRASNLFYGEVCSLDKAFVVTDQTQSGVTPYKVERSILKHMISKSSERPLSIAWREFIL